MKKYYVSWKYCIYGSYNGVRDNPAIDIESDFFDFHKKIENKKDIEELEGLIKEKVLEGHRYTEDRASTIKIITFSEV